MFLLKSRNLFRSVNRYLGLSKYIAKCFRSLSKDHYAHMDVKLTAIKYFSFKRFCFNPSYNTLKLYICLASRAVVLSQCIISLQCRRKAIESWWKCVLIKFLSYMYNICEELWQVFLVVYLIILLLTYIGNQEVFQTNLFFNIIRNE